MCNVGRKASNKQKSVKEKTPIQLLFGTHNVKEPINYNSEQTCILGQGEDANGQWYLSLAQKKTKKKKINGSVCVCVSVCLWLAIDNMCDWTLREKFSATNGPCSCECC